MTNQFKSIVKAAYQQLFIAYVGKTKGEQLFQKIDWSTLLKEDWLAYQNEKKTNPNYTVDDYTDLIWQADFYAIVDCYRLTTA